MAYAQGSPSCAPIFADDVKNTFRIYRDKVNREFVNVSKPRSGNINSPFAARYNIVTGETFDGRQKFTGGALPYLELEIHRGSEEQLSQIPNRILSQKGISDFGDSAITATTEVATGQIARDSQAALERLYSEFANQGPERRSLIETARFQDKTEGERVVHFTVGVLGQAFGHSQILVADSKAHSLHIEDQWNVSIPGTIKGEWGRLTFFSPNEQTAGVSVDGLEKFESEELIKLARTQLILEVFSYAYADIGLESLAFQVNKGMSKVLSKLGVPLNLAQSETLTKEYDGDVVSEFKYVMDRNALMKTQEAMMKRLLQTYLSRFLSSDQNEKLILRFSRNKFDTLVRLGILSPAKTSAHQKFEKTSTNKYLNLLSQDFIDSGSFFDQSQHAVLSWVSKYKFPVLGHLIKNGYQFEHGIFKMPEGFRFENTDIISLHFSRNAADTTLKLIRK
ncbi:MAG: hypothetical protein ACXWRG_18970 [Bdellovibrio sp.]